MFAMPCGFPLMISQKRSRITVSPPKPMSNTSLVTLAHVALCFLWIASSVGAGARP